MSHTNTNTNEDLITISQRHGAEIVASMRELSALCRLTGHAAIRYREAHAGTLLCSHTDPTAAGRTNITPEDAREIARHDPGVIYLNLTSRQAAIRHVTRWEADCIDPAEVNDDTIRIRLAEWITAAGEAGDSDTVRAAQLLLRTIDT